jgi:hypothetical protein
MATRVAQDCCSSRGSVKGNRTCIGVWYGDVFAQSFRTGIAIQWVNLTEENTHSPPKILIIAGQGVGGRSFCLLTSCNCWMYRFCSQRIFGVYLQYQYPEPQTETSIIRGFLSRMDCHMCLPSCLIHFNRTRFNDKIAKQSATRERSYIGLIPFCIADASV